MSMAVQVSPEVYARASCDGTDRWELADADGTFAVARGLVTEGVTFELEERDGQARWVRNPALGMEFDLGAHVVINLRIGDSFTFTLVPEVGG